MLIYAILHQWHAVAGVQKLELFVAFCWDLVSAAVRIVLDVQDFILLIVIVRLLTTGWSVSEPDIGHTFVLSRCSRLHLVEAITPLHLLRLVAHNVLRYLDLLVEPLLLLFAMF